MKYEYKTINTMTEAGLQEAETLKEQGWKIISNGFSTIQFERAVAYQVIGWSKKTKPENRNSRTVSDGVIVSNKDFALQYADKYMAMYEIEEIINPTAETVKFWDGVIRDFIEQSE